MIARFLGALSYHVRRAEIEWRATNPARRNVQYGWLRRRIVRAADRPILSSAFLLILFSLVTLFAYFGPFPRFPVIQLSYDDATALSYLSTIWAIQATVVALVYPIVIAFVTLLVQRLHQGQSILHIYMHDTAAVLSGSSALFLLFLLSIQYLLSPWTSVSVVLNWAFISGCWLALNIILTIFFLYRTFEFLRPARRQQTVRQYTVNVAWPAEVESHLRVHLFDNAVVHGLIPGPAYPPAPDGSVPTVWMGVTALIASDSTTVVQRNIATPKTLADVFFRPLAWATSSWLKRARRASTVNTGDEQAAHARLDPTRTVLIYPLEPDVVYSAQTILCSQIGSVPLARSEQLLIRLSFSFGRMRRDLDLTTAQIFDDFEREAMSAILSNEPQVFTNVVQNVEILLIALLDASAITDEAGELDSYASLTDRWSAFHRPVYERWTRVLIDLFKHASNAISANDEYLQKLIYVVPRMFSSLGKTGTKNILLHLIDLSPILFSRLGDWWVQTIEQQGTMIHTPCDMATVKPPFSSTYETLIRKYVGAWEDLKNFRFLHGDQDATAWPYYQRIAAYFERHLHHTVLTLSECVNRGDKTGAIWINDVLMKWISELEHDFNSYSHFFQRDRWITFEVLRRDWDDVKTALDIEEDTFGYGNVKMSVLSVALQNYWTDCCCVLAYHLSIWGRDCACTKSLPALLIKSFLQGRSPVGGSHSTSAVSPFANADDLLVSILRQKYMDGRYEHGYRVRLGHLVERLARVTAEKMVPGRTYSSSQINDLDSLRNGQLALLMLVTKQDWQPGETVERILRELRRVDDDKLRSFDRDLGQWKKSLADESFDGYRNLYDCVLQNPQRTFDDTRTSLVETINALSESIGTMREQALQKMEISQDRLEQIGNWASESGFSNETGAFPLTLFNTVDNTVEQEFDRRSVTLQNVNKGEHTEPPMAQRIANEQEWFDKTVRNYIGLFLLRDSLHKLDPREVEARSPIRYWEHMKAFAERTASDGHQPILLLENRTRPRWVYEWMADYRESDDRPSDLNAWRNPQETTQSYIGNMNDIAVYLAPSLSPGSSILMSAESFVSVSFTRFTTGNNVLAEPESIEGQTSIINLRLTWAPEIEIAAYPCLRLVYEDRK